MYCTHLLGSYLPTRHAMTHPSKPPQSLQHPYPRLHEPHLSPLLSSPFPTPHPTPRPSRQVMNRLCAAVACSQPSPVTRGYLLTALTKLAVAAGGLVPPDVDELLIKGASSVDVELQQRAEEARALLR